MSTPVKLYQQEMHDNIGYFATWLPGDPMALGDVGVLQAGQFRRFTSLKELGIPCKLGRSGNPQRLSYSSTTGTSIVSSAGAEAPGIAKAQIAIKFSKQGAFLFQALEVQRMELANRPDVATGILGAFEQKSWKKEWLVVDSVYRAESATIIVSEDSSAEVVLSASSALPLGSLPLADPKLGFTVSSTHGRIVHVLAASGLHPLYSCIRLKDPLFGSASVWPVRSETPERRAAQALSGLGLAELLDS